MSWNAYDIANGGGYPMMGGAGGLFGGATGGAFVGSLAGSLIGPALFDGRGRGGNWGGGCEGGGERVIQVNENGGRHGNNCGIGEWEIMKEVSDTRREVAVMPYIAQNTALEQTIAINQQMAATNTHIEALQMQICQSTNSTQREILESQYKALMQTAGLSREMAECCCKQLQATTIMGFETQLRDQGQHCEILKELQEVKCLVKDVEKDGIIRQQAAQISAMEGRFNTAEIISAMKPVAPVPAYIQANPFENFLPTVRVAEQRCCEPRWDSNCCGRGF